MSSSSRRPSSISPDNAASREDLELFQRLLRVARLLKTRDVDELWNGTNGNGDTPRRTEHAAGTDTIYGDDDYDDNDDDDDEDEDDEDGESAREGSTNAAAPSNQPVIPNNIKSSQSPRRKQSSKQQDSNAAAPKRRRLRQRQDQQQQPPQRPHAAVEKRYRSVVNSKFQQLKASIPPSNTFSPTHPNTLPESQAGEAATQEMPTKSAVLDRATQYITHLVATYELYETERSELRRRLQFWLDNTAPMDTHQAERHQT